jgi:ABC-2 type transport system permease protein
VKGLRLYGSAALAVLDRDLRIFASYRLRPLTLLVGPLTGVTLFYYVSRLVTVSTVGSSDGYFAYVVVGIVALEILTSTIATTPVNLRQELVAGTFERLVLSPFGAMRSMLAMMLFPLLQAFVIATVTLTFAAGVFGMHIAFPDVLLALPAGILGALAFAPFGLLTAAAILVVKQALAGVSILLTLMSIFAGVYFPVALLPDWIEWVSRVQPLTPAVDLLRHLISSAPTTDPPLLDAVKLVLWTGVLFPAALWVLSSGIRHSRQRGTIIEY